MTTAFYYLDADLYIRRVDIMMHSVLHSGIEWLCVNALCVRMGYICIYVYVCMYVNVLYAHIVSSMQLVFHISLFVFVFLLLSFLF